MKIVNFSELHKMDYSILRVNAFYQRRSEKSIYSTPAGGRPNSGLMYFIDCEKEHFDKKQPAFALTATRGDIAMIPQGFEYTCRYNNCGTVDLKQNEHLINFELYDEDSTPFTLDGSVRILKPQNSKYYFEKFHEILVLFNKDSTPSGSVKALLYQLLTDISLELHDMHRSSKYFREIGSGIIYLEQHYTSDIKISELSEMCHVCESYFRRLFKLYAGVSPIEYIIIRRLEKAKLMLEGSTLSIAEIAESIGFDDSSYFSRLYKRRMGISPGNQRNKALLI